MLNLQTETLAEVERVYRIRALYVPGVVTLRSDMTSVLAPIFAGTPSDLEAFVSRLREMGQWSTSMADSLAKGGAR